MNLKPAFSSWFVAATAMPFLMVAKAQPVPGGSLDPLKIPKYVEPLVIPPVLYDDKGKNVGVHDAWEIDFKQFDQQVLPGKGCKDAVAKGGLPMEMCHGKDGEAFPQTTLWGYGNPHDDSTFNNPSFTLEVTRNRKTSIKWTNKLVEYDGYKKKFLKHILQDKDGKPLVDQTLHWAAPNGGCNKPDRFKDCRTNNTAVYKGPIPMTVHVHGAHVGPGSDGYPESWWLPDADDIPYGYHTEGTFYESADGCHPGDGCAVDEYTNDQPTASLWYHDHTLGITRLNVYAGGAGFYLIRTPEDGETGLEHGMLPGPAPKLGEDPNHDPDVRRKIREIPIAIQPKSFNADGSLFYPADRAFFEEIGEGNVFGDNTGLNIPFIPDDHSDIHAVWNPEAFFNTMVVNGKTWPYLEVAADQYRFRLLNAADSRFLNLALKYKDTKTGKEEELPFYQIGAEQSLLPYVVKVKTGKVTVLNVPDPVEMPADSVDRALLMGPAERADVIVDFSGLPEGTEIFMTNTGPDAPFGGFPDVPADPGTTGQVMKFIVGKMPSSTPVTELKFNKDPGGVPFDVGVADGEQDLALLEEESSFICVDADLNKVDGKPPNCPMGSDPFAPKAAVLGVDGSQGPINTADPDGRGSKVQLWVAPIMQNPQLNDVEDWAMWNWSEDAHPIHLHLVKFEVVGRASVNSPNKLMLPEPTEFGWKDTVIAYPLEITYIRAKFDIAGLYVWHCHVLSHEDNEMMVPYCVGVPGHDCPAELFEPDDPGDVGCGIEFYLWNADEDEEVGPLQSSFCNNGFDRFSIEARPTARCSNVHSATIKTEGPNLSEFYTENVVPYTSFGDVDGEIFGKHANEGSYTVTAELYSDNDARGNRLSRRQFHFTVESCDY